jgi:hypothetical protein
MSEEYSERLLTDFSIGYVPILDAVPAREVKVRNAILSAHLMSGNPLYVH